jgi:hypothetical protein
MTDKEGSAYLEIVPAGARVAYWLDTYDTEIPSPLPEPLHNDTTFMHDESIPIPANTRLLVRVRHKDHTPQEQRILVSENKTHRIVLRSTNDEFKRIDWLEKRMKRIR